MKQAIIEILDKYAIPEWRTAWTFLSVKWNLIVGGFASVWLILPDDARASLISEVLGAAHIPTALVVLVVAALTVYFRLKAQPDATDATKIDPK